MGELHKVVQPVKVQKSISGGGESDDDGDDVLLPLRWVCASEFAAFLSSCSDTNSF